MSDNHIRDIRAREILSTGSFPTIEVEVRLHNGVIASASTPRGSSEGAHEPAFLLDGDPARYHGKGMLKAVRLVETTLSNALSGIEITRQDKIDGILKELDGTANFSRLGVNSVLAVSLACARAASISEGLPLYEYLFRFFDKVAIAKLPKPMVVVIEGGMHADNSTDFQEYMILGLADDPCEGVRHCAEIYQELGRVLKEHGHDINVGYEGAYAFTNAATNEEPITLIEEAIERSPLSIEREIALALDPAASEFHQQSSYLLAREKRSLTASEMISLYESLIDKHPGIRSIEDGLAEDDWDSWTELCTRLGNKCLVVGDDLTVTNSARVRHAIETRAINSLLVKPNQAGTLSDAIDAIMIARAAGCQIVVSHRGGGETNDTLIVDLAIAADAEYLKCGISRGERVAKYNYLMKVAADIDQ